MVDSHNVTGEDVADARNHFDANILSAFFDAIDSALAGIEGICELRLCKPSCQPRLLDKVADLCSIFFDTHAPHYIIIDIIPTNSLGVAPEVMV